MRPNFSFLGSGNHPLENTSQELLGCAFRMLTSATIPLVLLLRCPTLSSSVANRPMGASCRTRQPLMGLFPEDGGTGAGPATRSANLGTQDLVGFWTVYDEQSSQDAMSRIAAGQQAGSIFSSRMVLRADGQTSRGSDFPGGSWELLSVEGRKRLRLTLRNRAKREEWRYDGLVFWLDVGDLEGGDPADLAAALNVASGDTAGNGEAATEKKLELRAVGKATRWDVKDETSPRLLGEGRFSMIKLDVDRSTLTPTIKPFSQPADPEEIRRQQKTLRDKDRSEADDLRQLLEDVREIKRRHPEDWQQRMGPPEAAAEADGEAGAESD